jgi:hypothetical protein
MYVIILKCNQSKKVIIEDISNHSRLIIYSHQTLTVYVFVFCYSLYHLIDSILDMI